MASIERSRNTHKLVPNIAVSLRKKHRSIMIYNAAGNVAKGPIKKEAETIVPFSASKRSISGTNARRLKNAWISPPLMKGKVFNRYNFRINLLHGFPVKSL